MDFWQTLSHRDGLSPQSIALLAQAAEHVDYARKATVLCDGDTDRYTYFVERGSVRTYVMREERCIILGFAFEGEAATVELGRRPVSRCDYFIETLEPTTLVRIPRSRMEELFSTHIELADWGRRRAERQLYAYIEFFADFNWMDKSQQYHLLVEHYPELFRRVPLKDIASYLGVTPQTLSRIRAGIK